jgi:hypothetical protein
MILRGSKYDPALFDPTLILLLLYLTSSLRREPPRCSWRQTASDGSGLPRRRQAGWPGDRHGVAVACLLSACPAGQPLLGRPAAVTGRRRGPIWGLPLALFVNHELNEVSVSWTGAPVRVVVKRGGFARRQGLRLNHGLILHSLWRVLDALSRLEAADST